MVGSKGKMNMGDNTGPQGQHTGDPGHGPQRNGIHQILGLKPPPSDFGDRMEEDLSSRHSPASSPVVTRHPPEIMGGLGTQGPSLLLHEQALQQQLLQLKHQQQIQQQILLQQFHAQQQQLAEQHEKQLQHHMREYLEQQKRIEDEVRQDKERKDKERLEQIKKKEKHEQSAVASSEVKQKLQEFVLNKKHREATCSSSATSAPGLSRTWNGPPLSLTGPLATSAPDSGPTSTSSHTAFSPTHSFRHPLVPGKYEEDFPLRKAVSEPNLKMRMRRMFERRSSPLVARTQRPQGSANGSKRYGLGSEEDCRTSESGPCSPSSSTVNSHSIAQTHPISEDRSGQYSHLLGNQGSIPDLTLYTSPSLPNISLGRPAIPSAPGGTDSRLSEAEMRAAFAARLASISLPGQMLPGLPFYPPLSMLDPEFASNPSSPSYIQKQMAAYEQVRNFPQAQAALLASGICPGITDAQVAHARLSKAGLRPFGRTQSAPLPLGHPLLQGAPMASGLPFSREQYEQYLRDCQLHDQQQQHYLLKQHIRQTLLTRTGSRSHVENVEEETEAALQRELSRDGSTLVTEIMDLTRQDRVEEERPASRESVIKQQQRLSLQPYEGPTNGGSHHPIRALSRTYSSPLVTLSPVGSPQDSHVPVGVKSGGNMTALAYDALMNKHQCVCGSTSAIHPEHSGRLQGIWNRLQESGVVQKCLRVRSRKATLEELQSCHDEAYTLLFGTNPLYRQKLDPSKLADLSIKSFVMLPCGGVGVDSDTTWNDLHTPSASRMAAGCVLDLSMKVGSGEARNGFAVVRPPGHHAEKSSAMGFCFFNSVAIAAKQLRQRLGFEKILIVDWDVHHGNGIQQIFYDDPHVLYISIHRHDDGNFFPGTGSPSECGTEDGMGFNVNIAWSGLQPPMGDAEYLSAFRALVMPIAKDFEPEIVLVSAGFDAALGHPTPLGGYRVTPACFAYMTRQLMQLAGGKVVMALEGGYDIPSICDSVEATIRSLLGEELPHLSPEEISRPPCPSAIEVLTKTLNIQTPHWPVIKRNAHTIGLSAIEACRILGETLPAKHEVEDSETVSAMASLRVANAVQSNAENLYPVILQRQGEIVIKSILYMTKSKTRQ